MRALSDAQLLQAWERGLSQPPAHRPLTLLAAACPEISAEALANLSIGRRDACLLTLREWTFGSRLAGLTTCPACEEQLELALDVDDVRVESGMPAETAPRVIVDSREVRFRLPGSLDLAAVANAGDVAAARRSLLERCVLEVRADGNALPIEQLPADLEAAVVDRMAQIDPQADVRLALTCPACNHRWQATFDIAVFFWSEISAWASRLLNEVHSLAHAYGWCEGDILALSPWRRRFYLQRVRG